MKAILLILDGLGIGAMPDVAAVRPQDEGANTLGTLVQNVDRLRVPALLRLGLGQIVPMAQLGEAASPPLASYGRCRLAHAGADTYLGHQEIMGTITPPPIRTLMRQVAGLLEVRLAACGYRVRRPLPGRDLLVAEEAVIIGDNLEADPGLNINLTVATDLIDFEAALEIGKTVRAMVTVSRVIVFGGPGIDVDDILSHVHARPNGQIGVDSPALGVYNHNLRVVHLGYGVDPERQAASILCRRGIPVVLLGKMADLITCAGASRDPVVPTAELMRTLLNAYRTMSAGLIAATAQETDLAAHQGDLVKLAAVVEEADAGLAALLPEMAEGDVLIVSADHGNDPRLNVGLHTREETPLLFYRKGQPARPLGIRPTLADIGATITHLFGAPPTQDGSPIDSQRDA
jgi:phosphopentomutase